MARPDRINIRFSEDIHTVRSQIYSNTNSVLFLVYVHLMRGYYLRILHRIYLDRIQNTTGTHELGVTKTQTALDNVTDILVMVIHYTCQPQHGMLYIRTLVALTLTRCMLGADGFIKFLFIFIDFPIFSL